MQKQAFAFFILLLISGCVQPDPSSVPSPLFGLTDAGHGGYNESFLNVVETPLLVNEWAAIEIHLDAPRADAHFRVGLLTEEHRPDLAWGMATFYATSGGNGPEWRWGNTLILDAGAGQLRDYDASEAIDVDVLNHISSNLAIDRILLAPFVHEGNTSEARFFATNSANPTQAQRIAPVATGSGVLAGAVFNDECEYFPCTAGTPTQVGDVTWKQQACGPTTPCDATWTLTSEGPEFVQGVALVWFQEGNYHGNWKRSIDVLDIQLQDEGFHLQPSEVPQATTGGPENLYSWTTGSGATRVAFTMEALDDRRPFMFFRLLALDFDLEAVTGLRLQAPP